MEISEYGSRRSRRLPDRRCSEISEKPAKRKQTAHQFFGEDDMKASHGILFIAVCRIFCLHFLLLGSVDALTAQQQTTEMSPTAVQTSQEPPASVGQSRPLIWTRDDMPNPMGRGPVPRLTAVAPESGGFRMALICFDVSKQTSNPMLQLVRGGFMQLTIEPMNPRVKYKLHYVPPTTTVTPNAAFPNLPGTVTTSVGHYSATPYIRIDQSDPKEGEGEAQQLKFLFLNSQIGPFHLWGWPRTPR